MNTSASHLRHWEAAHRWFKLWRKAIRAIDNPLEAERVVKNIPPINTGDTRVDTIVIQIANELLRCKREGVRK